MARYFWNFLKNDTKNKIESEEKLLVDKSKIDDIPENTDTSKENEYHVILPANGLLNNPGSFDKNSPTWAFLMQWVEKNLDKLRIKNDIVSLEELQTAALRGEIKMLKRIKNIPEELKKLQGINE